MTRVDRLGRPANAPFAAALDLASPPVRIWVQSGLLITVLIVPTALAFAFDERQLNDISVWIKPLKFQASLALHLLTLAVLTTLVAGKTRDGSLLRVTAWLSSAMAIAEVGYITLQAARGRHSHFNFETAFEARMYNAMGVGAVILIAAAAVVGWLILRTPRDDVGAGLRLGAGLGLILGFAATLIVAGYLGGQASHWVGGVVSDANGLPVTGWSRAGGDLRVAHFFSLHMMQALPLVGWLADRTIGAGRQFVFAVTPVWLGVVVVTFVQALSGTPLLSGN